MSPIPMINESLPVAIRAVIDALSKHADVTAIALGGSRAARRADDASDYDIYVYVDADIPLDARRSLARRFDSSPEIGNTWFGPGDEWTDRESGIAIDLIYWDRSWFEQQIRDVIQRHRPSLGYSTAFWYTLRNSVRWFDRDGWFDRMHDLASSPYPEELQGAIVGWNQPLLRTTRSSYRHQVELAIRRHDPVSVHHRVTELLASVFDIIFALNRALHPGEKRQLTHVAQFGEGVPDQFEQRVRTVLRATADPERSNLLRAIDALCDAVDDAIRSRGLWHRTER